jgi:hypothetical protein
MQADNRHCIECLPKDDDGAVGSEVPAERAPVLSPEKPPSSRADAVISLAGTIRMSWIERGQVELDAAGKLVFPMVPDAPGLYRLRIVSAVEDEAVYIGESANLRRRFGNYRTPGPTQQTSLRINGLIRFALESGGRLFVATADEIFFEVDGASIDIDLGRTSMRRMLENFAISLERAEDVESLNL